MGEFRDVRPVEVIRALLALGGERRRGKGDHVNIKMPNGRIVTISGSTKSVKIGILLSSLRKADVSTDAFLKEIGRKSR